MVERRHGNPAQVAELRTLQEFDQNIIAKAFAAEGSRGDQKYNLSARMGLNPFESLYVPLLIGEFAMRQHILEMKRSIKNRKSLMQDPGNAIFARYIQPDANYKSMVADLDKISRAKIVYDNFVKLYRKRLTKKSTSRAHGITDAIYDLLHNSMVITSEDGVTVYISPKELSGWEKTWKNRL